jgi:hypothetical protein
VFNLGAGEVTVLLLLAFIFLGPSKLPDLAEHLAATLRDGRATGQAPHTGERWSRSDWLLLGTVMLLGSIAIAMALA